MALSAAQSQVATAIKELDNCPESVKQLLLAALQNAFGSNLHHFQKEAAALLRKSLEEGRTAVGEQQVESAQRVKEAQIVLETLQADAQSTTSSEEAARTVLAEKVLALETAEAAVKSEEPQCTEAEAAKAEVSVERQKLEAAKAEVESVQNGSLRVLLDGGWEEEEVRDACIQGVCSYMEEESADAVLLAALPKALGQRPMELGEFDKIVVNEAVAFFADKVAACIAALAEGEDRYEDVAAECTGAWAILELAREKVQEAGKVRNMAEADLQAATVDKKLAHSKVMDQDATLSVLLSEATMADAKVNLFDVSLRAIAELELGEAANQENKENAMMVDEQSKVQAMEVDHLPVAMTA